MDLAYNKDKSLEYYVQNKMNISNRKLRQWITENKQGIRSNKPRGSSQVYSTFYTLIQQEKVWEITRKTEMRSQNQSNRRSIQRAQYQGLCNDD